MENQAYLFIIYILNGFLISILFDFFRILRKSFKTNDLITYLEDIIFWILTAIILLYSVLKFNNGQLRIFVFIGIALGVIFYMLVFSKIFIKVNLLIINYIKKIILIVLIRPIKFIINLLKKILLKPTAFFFINIRKTLSNFTIKVKSLFNKKKKNKYKKDFV